MRRWRLCIAVACAGALGLMAATQGMGQTLELEELTAPPQTFTTTYSCNTEGTSTVSWTAEGIATGPYPGTFTASGSLTIGPQDLPGQHPPEPNREGTVAGPIESFQETFTIESGLTTITGSKTLSPTAGDETQGTCQQVSQFPVLDFFDGQGTVVEVSAQTRYQADIQGPLGTSTDRGFAFVSLSDTNITGSCPTGPECEARLAGFNQTFAISDGNGAPCDDDDDEEGERRDDDDDGDDECDDEDDD